MKTTVHVGARITLGFTAVPEEGEPYNRALVYTNEQLPELLRMELLAALVALATKDGMLPEEGIEIVEATSSNAPIFLTNMRTGKRELIDMADAATQWRDFIPQDAATQSLFKLFVAMGMSPSKAATTIMTGA